MFISRSGGSLGERKPVGAAFPVELLIDFPPGYFNLSWCLGMCTTDAWL